MKKRKSNNSDDAASKKAGETGRTQHPPGKVAVTAPAEEEDKKTAEVGCSWTQPVEEQMWWGSEWYPTCDVGSMGEAYITALYSDVWDGYGDIWSFRTQPPAP